MLVKSTYLVIKYQSYLHRTKSAFISTPLPGHNSDTGKSHCLDCLRREGNNKTQLQYHYIQLCNSYVHLTNMVIQYLLLVVVQSLCLRYQCSFMGANSMLGRGGHPRYSYLRKCLWRSKEMTTLVRL